LLLHVGCTANDPVGSAIVCRFRQAHLSAFSSPDRSSQPLGGIGSVTASRYSCPATIRIRVYRKPSAEFDAWVVSAFAADCVEVVDARYSEKELRAWVERDGGASS
jgi:hypothetical protein